MIELTENLVLSADDNQYIIGTPRRRAVEGGKITTTIDNPRYYSSLTTALNYAVSISVRGLIANGTIITINGILEHHQRLYGDFSKLLEPLSRIEGFAQGSTLVTK